MIGAGAKWPPAYPQKHLNEEGVRSLLGAASVYGGLAPTLFQPVEGDTLVCKSIAYLVKCRVGGFMVLVPSEPVLVDRLPTHEDVFGLQFCVITLEGKNKRTEDVDAVLLDISWDYVHLFSKWTQPRGEAGKAVLRFTMGDQAAKPQSQSVMTAAEAWIREEMDDDTAGDYVTGDEEPNLLLDPGGASANDIVDSNVVFQMQQRIQELEAKLQQPAAAVAAHAQPCALLGGQPSPDPSGAVLAKLKTLAGPWPRASGCSRTSAASRESGSTAGRGFAGRDFGRSRGRCLSTGAGGEFRSGAGSNAAVASDASSATQSAQQAAAFQSYGSDPTCSGRLGQFKQFRSGDARLFSPRCFSQDQSRFEPDCRRGRTADASGSGASSSYGPDTRPAAGVHGEASSSWRSQALDSDGLLDVLGLRDWVAQQQQGAPGFCHQRHDLCGSSGNRRWPDPASMAADRSGRAKFPSRGEDGDSTKTKAQTKGKRKGKCREDRREGCSAELNQTARSGRGASGKPVRPVSSKKLADFEMPSSIQCIELLHIVLQLGGSSYSGLGYFLRSSLRGPRHVHSSGSSC